MITAICEMQDQDVGIMAVQLIENTTESIEKFEDEMDLRMGIFGHVLHYYDAEIPDLFFTNEEKVYDWMKDNSDRELDL